MALVSAHFEETMLIKEQDAADIATGNRKSLFLSRSKHTSSRVILGV